MCNVFITEIAHDKCWITVAIISNNVIIIIYSFKIYKASVIVPYRKDVKSQ